MKKLLTLLVLIYHYGAGDFSSACAVESGDTLTLQVDLSAAAA